MTRRTLFTAAWLALLAAACIPTDTRSAFDAAAEEFGLVSGEAPPPSSGGGTSSIGTFRSELTLTLNNLDPNSDLVTSYIAWVSPASIRSADQQDALLSGGYVQLATEIKIGTAFTLVPGTFVLNGAGTAGRTTVLLTKAGGRAPTHTADIITPDALLVYLAPPTSCESPAFVYEEDGVTLEQFFYEGQLGAALAGATNAGAVKTLAQIDAYSCDPFEPGLFLRIGGGTRAANEYFEGSDVNFDFIRLNAQAGPASAVTITTP